MKGACPRSQDKPVRAAGPGLGSLASPSIPLASGAFCAVAPPARGQGRNHGYPAPGRVPTAGCGQGLSFPREELVTPGDGMSGLWGADQPARPGSHDRHLRGKAGSSRSLHPVPSVPVGAGNSPESPKCLLDQRSCLTSF